MEIVGEAAGRISPDIRARNPRIPWAEIVSLRNHPGYDSVDLDILWKILKDDIPRLIAELERIVPPEEDR